MFKRQVEAKIFFYRNELFILISHSHLQLSYYVFTIYIPTFMTVCVSWMSFWLDHKSAPARVALTITTLLAMSTTTSSINNSLPPVAYTKAIDVWNNICVSFVFLALLEYALVNYAARADARLAQSLGWYILIEMKVYFVIKRNLVLWKLGTLISSFTYKQLGQKMQGPPLFSYFKTFNVKSNGVPKVADWHRTDLTILWVKSIALEKEINLWKVLNWVFPTLNWLGLYFITIANQSFIYLSSVSIQRYFAHHPKVC